MKHKQPFKSIHCLNDIRKTLQIERLSSNEFTLDSYTVLVKKNVMNNL